MIRTLNSYGWWYLYDHPTEKLWGYLMVGMFTWTGVMRKTPLRKVVLGQLLFFCLDYRVSISLTLSVWLLCVHIQVAGKRNISLISYTTWQNASTGKIWWELYISTVVYYRSLAFNFRGWRNSGLSTTKLFCTGVVDDMDQVIRHIKQHFPKSPLIAAGTSLGG